jgi:hypothetical protein
MADADADRRSTRADSRVTQGYVFGFVERIRRNLKCSLSFLNLRCMDDLLRLASNQVSKSGQPVKLFPTTGRLLA